MHTVRVYPTSYAQTATQKVLFILIWLHEYIHPRHGFIHQKNANVLCVQKWSLRSCMRTFEFTSS